MEVFELGAYRNGWISSTTFPKIVKRGRPHSTGSGYLTPFQAAITQVLDELSPIDRLSRTDNLGHE
jgi:hypothetical protein